MAQPTDLKHAYTRQPCFASGDGIICAGLPRSGTFSLTSALTTLGITPVHHALTQARPRDFYAWGRASWCNFPRLRERRLAHPMDSVPSALFAPHDPLLPWRRADWDCLIGDYRATSDIAAVFSEDLIRCYPEAKVILVERDVERWKASFGGIFVDQWFFGWDWFVLCFLAQFTGHMNGTILSTLLMDGWLGAGSKEEAWRKLGDKHREHSEMVRRLVPEEQLLVFKLEDGWAPLCKFLDVPVPEGVPFPHVNDKEALMAFRAKRKSMVVRYLAKRAGVAVVVVVMGLLALRRKGEWVRRVLGSVMGSLGIK